MKSIFFDHHNRDEIKEMATEGYSIVVPLASTEQHGPHLPVCTDSIICDYIVTKSILKSSKVVPVLKAPLLTVGCSSHHLSFGGTISFTSSTYLHVLRDIGESLVSCGFRKIIFINGHGGNEPLMIQTVNDLAVNFSIWTASASYWSIAREALKETNAAEVGMIAGHAGGFETSVILALQPDLVNKEHINISTHRHCEWIGSYPAGTFLGKHKELTGADGYTDAANKSTAEKGRKYLDVIVNAVAEWLISISNTMEENS